MPFAALAQTTAPAPLPPEAQAAVDKGVLAAKDQGYLLAIRYFQDARKLAPLAPEIYYDLGLAESKIPGRELRALGWFGAYLTANPNASNAAAVKGEIERLDVKSQSDLSRLIKTVQDAARPAQQYRYDWDDVAKLWTETGDVTAALKIVDLFAGSHDKSSIQESIVTGQIDAGDFVGAQKTADSIQSAFIKSEAQMKIAEGQIHTKDSAGAQKTLASALKTTDLISDADIKSQELSDIARTQADADDMAGAQVTFAAALKNTDLITGDKYATISKIARNQAAAYDIAGAQKTAELLQDEPDYAWKRQTQLAIHSIQQLQNAGLGHIPKSRQNAVAQIPIQPVVPVATVSDFLKKLDEDQPSRDCALNTGPFLDLPTYLKSLPASDNPETVFANLRDTALKIVKAQSIIDHLLKQQAGK